MEKSGVKSLLNLKSVAAATLIILLILIFLSKTIYNYNLPVVTAVSPQNGRLNKLEVTTGIVKYQELNQVYSEKGGKIYAVLVDEGDAVTKGQPVIQMDFENETDELNKQLKSNRDDLDKKLSDLKIARDKLQVDIEKINTNIDNANRKIDELNREVYRQDSVSDYELNQTLSDIQKAELDLDEKRSNNGATLTQQELVETSEDIRIAESDLESIRLLKEVGAVSRQEVDNAEIKLENLRRKRDNLQQSVEKEITDAESNLENLRRKYDNLKQSYDDNLKKSDETIEDKEINREKQIKDYKYQIETYNQELKSKKFDLSSNAAQEAAYRKEHDTKAADILEDLAEFSKCQVVYAPEDSFVLTIPVDKGQYVGANQQLASFGLTKEYIIDCEIPLNNNFVLVGDECALSNSTHSMDGTVTKITPGERSKTVTLTIPPEDVSAGETFDIMFEKVSDETYTLVPNGAVNMDSDGYFLRQIKRRDGILGKEFYTEKLRVYIGDSDTENTAILKGVGFFEPLVLLSDKSFSDGDTVKLANESDFFED